MENPEDTTQLPAILGTNKYQINSSLVANSSDYFGDIIEESGNDADGPVQHQVTYEVTVEEKKEADAPSSVNIDSGANDPNSHEGVADDAASKPPPQAVVVEASSTITFKFSYQPREYEQEYYDQLFYHVASTSNTPIIDKPKEEIIVSPKEAAKLFYKSGVPSERLRMIWNMATLPSTPLPPGTKPPPSMTHGQFRVAVRLIQLFQNRVAAVNEQLTVSEDGAGGGRDGGSDCRLAPAYFNGISGEIIPLPNNNTVDAIKSVSASDSNGVPASKPNEMTSQARRRSSSLSSSEEKRPSNGSMNGNRPAYEEAKNDTAKPMSRVEMEREIRRLKAMVSTLQREVKELKRGNANNVQRNNVPREDEDPTVGVEIYWGDRKGKELSSQQPQQSPQPQQRSLTPNERPLPSKISRSSRISRSSTPTAPQYTAMDERRRLSQSQNIPAMHPSIPRRTKTNLGIPAASGAETVAAQVLAPAQTISIPEEAESLTSQMHAVRRQEEFDTLLSQAKESIEGDVGSKGSGSRQSNRSVTFRPALVGITTRRSGSARGNRPADLSASARHIVRDKTGRVELYTKVDVEPPSTKAVDLAPLNPPPFRPSIDDEPIPVAHNHRMSLIRRR
eukprot:CAMPEP_0201703544 /NCGR_PEP_ID=MMETSP0578-20130828/39947_1 /ASSEMBLY_ACC=CAM_ASM_000663 /TAXON_ID=267565 /ORGANISM="Skeletonema grethea, Strain CCMP 1804" /LENGTH=618 /DNA_ID=CAMNT_0048191349 /DNA_START=106 /DNA_END=1962 /DNA_ORIENTATION=-